MGLKCEVFLNELLPLYLSLSQGKTMEDVPPQDISLFLDLTSFIGRDIFPFQSNLHFLPSTNSLI